jgi:hypothetical protein
VTLPGVYLRFTRNTKRVYNKYRQQQEGGSVLDILFDIDRLYGMALRLYAKAEGRCRTPLSGAGVL